MTDTNVSDADRQAWRRVWTYVEARRDELLIKPKALVELAEISATTFSNMRRYGTPLVTVVKRTLLEDALRWARGSIQQILEDGEPTPLAPGTESPAPDALDDTRDLLLTLIELAQVTVSRMDRVEGRLEGIEDRMQRIEQQLASTAGPSQWNGEERREGC